MDPVTVLMNRDGRRATAGAFGFEYRVFTGFLTSVPVMDLWPAVCSIQAECTLKRILHTYWDPPRAGKKPLAIENPPGIIQDDRLLGKRRPHCLGVHR